jgi:hypothetical protein
MSSRHHDARTDYPVANTDHCDADHHHAPDVATHHDHHIGPDNGPTTSALNFPPSLILYPTASPQGYSVTVDGSVAPGTAGATITRVNWNWGDGVIEDHAVPNTHTYAGIGSYTITVTAFQSDGQSTTRSMTVFVSGPTEATTVPTTAPPATATQPPVTSRRPRRRRWARRSSCSTRRNGRERDGRNRRLGQNPGARAR